MRKLVHAIALLLVLGLSAPVLAGPFEDAWAAYNKNDYPTALRLLRPLADQGDGRAQMLLAVMYFVGDRGVPQDYAVAVKWYRLAADQDFVSAQTSLGTMYEKGRGVPQDYAAAVKWYRLAADRDDGYAQVSLGTMYAEGRGVPQDYVQAHKWYNLGATAGNEDAIKNRDIVAGKMTPAQIAEAQKLASAWKPK
jgi:TPR repeat protein